MAGMGPAPKDPSKRARRNKDSVPSTVLRFEESDQPALPDFSIQVEVDGELTSQRFVWPEVTREWWAMWGEAPQAEHFGSTDWSFLLDTALLHARVWGDGDLKLLPELRLRVAKFGSTLEDRTRLRMQFADADAADSKRPVTGASARERRGNIRVIKPDAAASGE